MKSSAPHTIRRVIYSLLTSSNLQGYETILQLEYSGTSIYVRLGLCLFWFVCGGLSRMLLRFQCKTSVHSVN